MIVVGIDPGLKGAFAVLPFGEHAAHWPTVFDIPTQPVQSEGATVRSQVDVLALQQKVLAALPAGIHVSQVLVYIEALATGGIGPGRGNATTNGSQHRTRGEIEATLRLLGLTVLEVHPLTWKKLYGLTDREHQKAAARSLATSICADWYPPLEGELKRVMDHNRAESILIAHWARKAKA